MTETAAPGTASAEDPWTVEYEAKCRSARVRALRYLGGRELMFSAAYAVSVGVEGQIRAQGWTHALDDLRAYFGVTSEPQVDDGFATWTHHVGRDAHRVDLCFIEERS